LALDGLQSELTALFRTVRDARAAKVNLVRYADDFIITASSKEFLENEVKPLVVEFLAARGLVLSEKKTKITHVTEGFDFLGWNVRLFERSLLVRPSKKNVKAFLDKIRSLLKSLQAVAPGTVIDQLTPIIRGWANYHRSQNTTRTFAKCDHQIWQALWRWACRRHPTKGKRWIKQRYFRCIKGRQWRFADKDKLLPGLSGYMKYVHIKINSEANPYDPKDDAYFSKRLAQRMGRTLEGRHKLRWLWWWQEGRCPVCEQKITRKTGWHLHHIVKRSERGSDKLTNLILLHPNCHMQHHVNEKYGPAGISMYQ
jgi:RNA-directed DNA polymerase